VGRGKGGQCIGVTVTLVGTPPGPGMQTTNCSDKKSGPSKYVTECKGSEGSLAAPQIPSVDGDQLWGEWGWLGVG